MVNGVDEKADEVRKFFVDVMLGSLATHLRALGFDTEVGRITPQRPRDDRICISRNRALKNKVENLLLLSSERLEDQIMELKEHINITPRPGALFSRCLRCNSRLINASEEALQAVPEYIRVVHQGEIRFCEMCKRCYWPGSHRQHMEKKFKTWGLL